MFAPLLEDGYAREEPMALRDALGVFRSYGLRIGMFMADIPEICRMLGNSRSCRYPLDITYMLQVF